MSRHIEQAQEDSLAPIGGEGWGEGAIKCDSILQFCLVPTLCVGTPRPGRAPAMAICMQFNYRTGIYIGRSNGVRQERSHAERGNEKILIFTMKHMKGMKEKISLSQLHGLHVLHGETKKNYRARFARGAETQGERIQRLTALNKSEQVK